MIWDQECGKIKSCIDLSTPQGITAGQCGQCKPDHQYNSVVWLVYLCSYPHLFEGSRENKASNAKYHKVADLSDCTNMVPGPGVLTQGQMACSRLLGVVIGQSQHCFVYLSQSTRYKINPDTLYLVVVEGRDLCYDVLYLRRSVGSIPCTSGRQLATAGICFLLGVIRHKTNTVPVNYS